MVQEVRKARPVDDLVNTHRPKHNFTTCNLTRILLPLWLQDDLIFIPERSRIQFHFIILVYYWTGTRWAGREHRAGGEAW